MSEREWLVFSRPDDPDRLDCGTNWAIIRAESPEAAVDRVYNGGDGGVPGDLGAKYLVIPAPRAKGVLIELALRPAVKGRQALHDTDDLPNPQEDAASDA